VKLAAVRPLVLKVYFQRLLFFSRLTSYWKLDMLLKLRNLRRNQVAPIY